MKKLMSLVRWLKENSVLASIFAWFVIMWSWVLFTDTLDLAGSHTQGLIVAIIVLVANASLSTLIIWNTFRVADYILKKLPTWAALLLLLPIFSLADWLTAWVPSIIWVGPQALLDSVLPLASPALVAINTPLGFASRFIGFFGLAGFVWMFIYLIQSKKYKAFSLAPLIVLVFLSFTGWLMFSKVNGVSLKTTVISENLDNHVPVIENTDSELVIFPEYGLDNITQDNVDERIKVNQEADKTFFLGSQQIIPDPNNKNEVGHYNTLLYGNSQEGITKVQDKYRLIPGGEDLPYLVRTGLRATNQKDTLDYFSYAKGVIRGKHQLQPLEINENVIVGAAVCSSIIAPQDYRDFASSGATVFSNSASLTIFKGSPLFAWQQKSFAKFMAISNSRYFLQSANAARAYVLDNNGNTIIEKTGIQTADVNVKTNNARTFYTIVGDWLPAIGALIASILLIKHYLIKKPLKTKKKSKKNK